MSTTNQSPPSRLPDPADLPADLPGGVRLLLDAYEQCDRAIEALPTPGRGGALGRLNAGAWIVAHVALQQDAYWNVTAGEEADVWLAAANVGHGAEPSTPDWDEASAAWRRVQASAVPRILGIRSDDLDGPDGAQVAAHIARATAHLFVHAAELATIGSLVGAGDLGLPGALRYSTARPARDE